jgi:tetratricopeptide (TPR) repeat protein
VGVWGAKPVTATSADPGITGVRPTAIGRDHIAICKLPDKDDQIYEGVLAFLEVDALAPRAPTPEARVAIGKRASKDPAGNSCLNGRHRREREGGTARLAEAVAAYREALKEGTRERVPLDWAMTQNNLGLALARLGERESGTARLEAAVEAFREALKERTRERVPLQWAMTQMNLGTALLRLGERERGTATLQEAVEAYREAFKKFCQERVPLQWAMTQMNLGTALRTLGERESGTARLEEAVSANREALKEYTQERVPLQWAMTQNNLGAALGALGERESGTAHGRRSWPFARRSRKEPANVYRSMGDDADESRLGLSRPIRQGPPAKSSR